MRTLTGHCESSKEVSLSKATKILSKFVSADNGASEALNAFLIRASEAFDELNQLHKELKPAQSHRKNRRSETVYDSGRSVEGSVRSFDVKSENGSRRERFRDEKLSQDDVKVGQEINGFVVGGGREKHNKKDKKKKLEFGDEKLDKKEQNGIELGHGDEEETEEGRKEKREKKTKTKKNKEVKDEKLEDENAKGQEQEKKIETQMSNKMKVENGEVVAAQDLEIRSKKRYEAGSEKERKKREKNLEGESEKIQEQSKEIEKKLSNGVKSENEELVDHRDVEIRSKKKYEAGNENNANVEEVKTERKKKRKNGDAEERSGELSKKKMKRKHEGYA